LTLYSKDAPSLRGGHRDAGIDGKPHDRILALTASPLGPSRTQHRVRAQTVLFESDIVRVRAVRCAAAPSGCGPIEWSAANTIVFPETGVFVKHLGRHAAVVADCSHAIFFTANRPYRVSHPVPGGDECLVLGPPPGARGRTPHERSGVSGGA
jgi:hypothetical protein